MIIMPPTTAARALAPTPLPPHAFSPWPLLAVLGTSLGVGIVVYQIAQSSNGGFARIEIGRSKFRYAANPSFLHSVLPSLKSLVFVECPLYYNMSAVMGLSHFDSDDDDESDMRSLYMLDWKPEVRLDEGLLSDRASFHIDRVRREAERRWKGSNAGLETRGASSYCGADF